MGKPTGFMEYKRQDKIAEAPESRIRHFQEFHTPLSREEQEIQGARCMACGVPFCQSGQMLNGMASGCPLHNLVPEWNDLIYNGNWEEAYYRLAKTNNFPEFTSRVCPALCENACTCGLHEDPVSTKANEYGIIENAYEKGYAHARPPKVRTGKKVAVIGSGPSGLAAADQLNRRGHLVTVYEREDKAGGLLRYGIPNMKLEKQIIDRKIAIMEEEGVVFRTGCNVGKDIKAASLLKEYDRIILACGASNPRDIKAPGRDASGIHFAVDFLKSTTKALWANAMKLKEGEYISAKGKRVMVIGGGDTGNDCVGTAIRHGAKSVLQLEMMPKAPDQRAENNPWPEWPKICKTDYGQQEAIALFGHDPRVYTTTVKEFVKDKKGALCKAVLVKLESKKDEKTGRMVMAEIAGSEYTVDVDLVLIAAGFLGSESYVSKAFGVELNERTNVKTAAGEYQTNVENVFTAGDMHRGQSLVVWAIREGREAARQVDLSLMGYTNLSVQ
ncbi:MAG: glutamate synthase subunit beta [Ruminococcus sp.]|nr:glutamate synthase subunit beta [Ruminococcus sp.]